MSAVKFVDYGVRSGANGAYRNQNAININNAATLYDVFQRIRAADEYFGLADNTAMGTSAQYIKDNCAEEDMHKTLSDEEIATITSIDPHSSRGTFSVDRDPLWDVQRRKNTGIEDYAEESRQGKQVPTQTGYKLKESGRAHYGDVFRSKHFPDALSCLQESMRRSRARIWWQMSMAPAIKSGTNMLREVVIEITDILKSFSTPDIFGTGKHFMNRHSSVHLSSVEYAFRKDTVTRSYFRIENNGVVINKKKLNLIIRDIREYDSLYAAETGTKPITFTEFCYMFSKYLSNDESDYTNDKAVDNEEERYRGSMITEIVEKNTYGLSMNCLDEFLKKSCLLDSNWFIEPIPK